MRKHSFHFAIRSERVNEPTLSCPTPSPTERWLIETSSVSPDRAETTLRYPATSAAFNVVRDSVTVPAWFSLIRTALVCGGFEISNAALDACLEKGMRFPRDMAFVGFGDPRAYRWINDGISTISLPVRAMAQWAVAMVLRPDSDPVQTKIFETQFIERHST